jgi:hypothetical protein
MSIGMNQSKELNHSKNLTLKVKLKRHLQYLPASLTYLSTYLVLPTYLPIDLPTYLLSMTYPPTYLV